MQSVTFYQCYCTVRFNCPLGNLEASLFTILHHQGAQMDNWLVRKDAQELFKSLRASQVIENCPLFQIATLLFHVDRSSSVSMLDGFSTPSHRKPRMFFD